jgi:electron transport complex protein RnfD
LSNKTAFLNGALYQRPQVSLAYSSVVRMWMVSGCAGLAILQSSLTDSFSSLAAAFGAVLGAVLSELAVTKTRPGILRDGSAVASALVFSLLLPNTFHPFQAFLGAAFGMLVVKYSFGGLGANWLNPALGAWLFVRCSWPGAFNEALAGSPLAALSELLRQGETDPQGSPLGILLSRNIDLTGLPASGGEALLFPASGGILSGITSTLNRTVFTLTGAELPQGYLGLFIPWGPGIIADRGLLCFLLGTLVLMAFQVSRSWIPAVFLGVYVFLVRVAGAVFLGGVPGNGDILFGLCSGGVMVSAFLLASDPATGPKTAWGALAYAVLAGFFAFAFRYIALEPYGAFFAVILLNMLTPLIRELEVRLLYRNGGKK